MLRTRFWKLTAIASALALAAMAPAAAAGGPPDDRGGAGGSQMKAGGASIAAPMAAGDGAGGPGGGSGGGSGGPPDGVGGGGGAGKPDNPGGGEDPDAVGNNLSYPVIWSEADEQYRLDLQGTMLSESLLGPASPCSDGTGGQGALQQEALNTWQAENMVMNPNSVTTVDWGDALEATDANKKMQRVETSLYSAQGTNFLGYLMCKTSDVDETGPNEMWGAVKGEAPTTMPLGAMVYTAGARLTIQRIDPAGVGTWNPSLHKWEGCTDDPIVNQTVYSNTGEEGGPGVFGVEVTISGKITYGYIWETSGLTSGEYRLTFSLDGPVGGFPGSGTTLVGAGILEPEEETTDQLVAEAEEDPDGGAPGANTAYVSDALNLTYIDVYVDSKVPAEPFTCSTTPATGGGTSTPAAPAPAPVSTEQTPAEQGGQPEATTPQLPPQAATALFVQKAKIKALKSGKYAVGTKIVLAKKRVKTSAGVTVRWRATVRSQDNCMVKIRKSDGKATVTFIKPGRCRVIAWAPPASPDWAAFRATRTYRVVNAR